MAGKRDKPEDVVLKLQQVEVLQGQGMGIAEAVRQIGVSQQTYYRWRKQYGGMSRDQLKRRKELETENARLRRAVSDLTLDKMILTEAARDEGCQGNHPMDGFQPRTRSPSKPVPPPTVHRSCAAASFHAAQGPLWPARRRTFDRGHHRHAGRRVRALWIARQAIAQRSAARGNRMITGLLNNSGWHVNHMA